MQVTDARIGVLGLGRMGLLIAARLRSAGFVVVAFDPDEARRTAARDDGLGVAGSATELARESDVLVTVLPGATEAAGALADDRAIVSELGAGNLWLDLTSSDPVIAEKIATAVAARGARSVAAPMAGGPASAANGGLQFFVAGDPTAVALATPILTALGGDGAIKLVGSRVGEAHTAKLLANLLWFGQVIAVTEAMLLGQALGLAPATLLHILANSSGGSVFIDDYLASLLEGDYLESFGIDRCVEELETIARLAQRHDVPFELSALVARLHRDALDRFGALDGEMLAARLLEERAGTTLRR